MQELGGGKPKDAPMLVDPLGGSKDAAERRRAEGQQAKLLAAGAAEAEQLKQQVEVLANDLEQREDALRRSESCSP